MWMSDILILDPDLRRQWRRFRSPSGKGVRLSRPFTRVEDPVDLFVERRFAVLVLDHIYVINIGLDCISEICRGLVVELSVPG